jgi:hypothetical protein
MQEMLKYRLTIGWYSKGVRLRNEETGNFSGKDSDLKIIDDVCRYYNIPSIIGFDPICKRLRLSFTQHISTACIFQQI